MHVSSQIHSKISDLIDQSRIGKRNQFHFGYDIFAKGWKLLATF